MSEKATFLKILSSIKDFKSSVMKQLSLRLSEIIHQFLDEAKPSFSYQEVNNLAEGLKGEVLKYFSNAYEKLLSDAISLIRTELERSTKPSEILELENKLKQLNDVIGSLKDIFSSALGTEVKENEIVDRAKELLKIIDKAKGFESILEEREKALESLQREIDEIREKTATLEKELNIARKEKEGLEEERNSLNEKISELEKELAEKNDQIKKLKIANSKLTSQIEKLKEDFAKTTEDFKKMKEKLEEEKDSLSKRVSDLERELFEKKDEIRRLKKTIEDVSVSGDMLQKELLKAKDQITEKDLQIRKLERELTEKDAEIKRLKTINAELSSELEKIKEDFVKATADFEGIKKELQKLSEDKERLLTLLDRLGKHISSSPELRLISFLMNLKSPLTVEGISKSLGTRLDVIKESLQTLEEMKLVKIKDGKVILTF